MYYDYCVIEKSLKKLIIGAIFIISVVISIPVGVLNGPHRHIAGDGLHRPRRVLLYPGTLRAFVRVILAFVAIH